MSKCSDDGIEAGPLTVRQLSGCCEESGCTSGDSDCGCGYRTAYYNRTAMCPEDNRQVVNTFTLVGSIKNKQDFSMPACGAQLRVPFDYVGDFPTGAWLWAKGYGFLTILGYNSTTEELTLRNDCPSLSCNNQTQASVGTPIPKCTVWTLTVPQCPSASGSPTALYPYLNVGFAAPANGTCIDVIFTNVNGLSVGKKVSLNNGIYRISAIKSATLVTICNDGEGLVPGTSVEYKNDQGALLVPVVLIDSNVCLNTAGTSGALLVCDGGVTKPLAGNANGQVPVLDIATGKVTFRTVSIDVLSCTQLTQPLTIDPSFPPDTAYLATVGPAGTALFTVAGTVQIGVERFTIDSILTGTTMRVVPNVIPGGVTLYPVGTAVCSIGCCEQLRTDTDAEFVVDRARLTSLESSDASLRSDVKNDQATPKTTGSITLGQTINGNEVITTVINNSPSKAMNVLVRFSSEAMVTVNGVAGQYAQLSGTAKVAASVNPVAALVAQSTTARTFTIPTGQTNSLQSIPVEYTGAYIIPAGETWTFRSNMDLDFGAGNAATITPALSGINNKIALIGVSEL